jgi:hypothetical protein
MEVSENVACIDVFRFHPKGSNALHKRSDHGIVETIYVVNLAKMDFRASKQILTYNNCITVIVLDLLKHLT